MPPTATTPGEFVAKTTRLTEKIKTLQEQMRRMDGMQRKLDKQEEAQISLTDPDSRSMTFWNADHSASECHRFKTSWCA